MKKKREKSEAVLQTTLKKLKLVAGVEQNLYTRMQNF